MAVKRWVCAPSNKARSQEIASRFGIAPFAAHLLQARGIVDDDKIEETLYPENYSLSDPMALPDMDKAAERIKRAVADVESIVVFGDYDVDGITATALLYTCLKDLGADVMYMLPSRDEGGYGLCVPVLDEMKARGVQLIVTVDNGISAVEEIRYARSLGIDTVVTDHHRPPAQLPEALALVDAHLDGAECPFKEFAGVGVAFKLACVLEGSADIAMEKYGDLVALGTVADMVPLAGENRALLAAGLKVMAKGKRLGLKTLMMLMGLEYGAIKSSDISYKLAPRINAAGRVGKPDKVVRLLCSDDIEECRQIANELAEDNELRHKLGKEIDVDAWKLLCESPELMRDRVVVVCGENWHHGVVGIAAQHLCETLGKPSIVLSSDGDTVRGSGRCFGEFSMHGALAECSELLMAYGGHKSAAGLTIEATKVDEFRRRINRYAAHFGEMPVRELRYDCKLPASMMDLKLIDDAQCLEPFGMNNPSPVIMLERMKVTAIRPMGKGGHQRLELTNGDVVLQVVYFGVITGYLPCRVGDTVDCLVTLGKNEYRGVLSLNLIVEDMRLSSLDIDAVIAGERLYECFVRGEAVSREQAERLLPSREDFAKVYRWLKPYGFRGAMETLYTRLAERGVTYERMRIVLDVLRLCEIIDIEHKSCGYDIYVRECCSKVDLAGNEIMRRLSSLAE